MRRNLKMFIDGYAKICSYKRLTSSFQAIKNATSMDDLSQIGVLAFDEQSKRQQDIQFAEASNRSLSLKIRTPLKDEYCNQKYCLVIYGKLYDIITIDIDRLNRVAYWYLEEVRSIA